jgi:hypothetical protein
MLWTFWQVIGCRVQAFPQNLLLATAYTKMIEPSAVPTVLKEASGVLMPTLAS